MKPAPTARNSPGGTDPASAQPPVPFHHSQPASTAPRPIRYHANGVKVWLRMKRNSHFTARNATTNDTTNPSQNWSQSSAGIPVSRTSLKNR